MFQILNGTEKTKDNLANQKNILANIISKKYILLYVLVFMVSMVDMGYTYSPFSIAIIAACIATEIPIMAVLILSLVGNIINSGISGTINFVVILLVFFASFFIKEPKYNDSNRNEKILLAKRLFFSSLIVNLFKIIINQFLIYDFLVAVSISILVVIFYKIFANSLIVITRVNEKNAFSIEEVLGASLILAIAVCCFKDLAVFGFCIRNVFSIFIVLVLGWKYGILIGTTAGATIGITLGIIALNDPIIVATYCLSGMIAGILNKFGKIGVIGGFILGNVILSYVSSGLIINVILFKEILIAGLALLAVPRNINLNIENILDEQKYLPIYPNRSLNKSKKTAEKLNNVSNAVEDIAKMYQNAAITNISKEDIIERNKQKFIAELLNRLDYMEDNILYDIMEDVDSPIYEDIFKYLMENQYIKEKDLIKILENNNNYVAICENKEKRDIEKMVDIINSSYRISKSDFIWFEKINEEKKNFETQLRGVSKAISDLANDIKEDIDAKELYTNQKEEIIKLLKQKEILTQDIEINKKKNERFKIDLYIENTNQKDVEKTIKKIITNVIKEDIIIKNTEEIEKQNIIKYEIISNDKYILNIGYATKTKDGEMVSGDSILKTKLNDGKYLIAISDGMGSGAEARKSSQVVISMLKRFLNSGFNKETSIELINANLLNISEEIFATLDIAIVDLYQGNIEFIKNGACPTYIKNGKKIQIIKSYAFPTGIIKEAKADVFDKDIENGDIIVMLTDGILDANVEYKNKELWIKYLLEDINILDPKKIADIILNEAKDNNYGKIKDDMSIIACKLIKKEIT